MVPQIDRAQRISSSNQKDTSIDDHAALIRVYLARHDGAVADDFVLTDCAVSGSTHARAGFEKLLSLVEKRGR